VETIDYVKFLLVLALVIGLILAMSWGLKRLGVGTSSPGLLGQRRLGTVETSSIDARHRLILVRRDSVEHLVLVGPTSSLLIETGIPAPTAGAPGAASGPGAASSPGVASSISAAITSVLTSATKT
jgi:flagellar protein FliO/FliZ